MHIPNEMLSTPVCPVTAAIAAGGIGLAAYAAWKTRKSDAGLLTPGRFASVGAVIFAAQMLNFPIFDGVSGHFAGGVLAATLLGVPGGMICMALILTLQALLFADGGLNTLGANVLNMALLGAGVGGMLRLWLLKSCRWSNAWATGVAAALGTELAAFGVFVELACEGKASLEVFNALMGAHTLIALAEGVITAALAALLNRGTSTEANSAKPARAFVLTAAIVTLVALLVSPLACAFPDALEATLMHFHLTGNPTTTFAAPMPDYAVTQVSNSLLSGYLAAIVGILATAVCGFGIGLVLKQKPSN